MLDKHFSVIFITLGRDCNFNCKYCLQDEGHFHKRKQIEVPELSEKLLRFLDSYNYEHTKVMLWGGEPLLYFESIRKLVERYGNKFDWGTITNGSLLNEEIIAFFDKYNISLTVSHDGEATEYTRGIDVLKNERIKNLLKGYRNFTGFSSVFSSANDNHRKLYACHAELGFAENNTGTDMIYNTSDTSALTRLAVINEENYKKSLSEAFWGYEQVELHNNKMFFKEWQLVKNMIAALNSRLSHKSESPYRIYNMSCSTCKDMLNIDYNGDVFICHNSTYKVGTVEDDYEIILEGLRTYLKERFTPKCRECSVFGVCQGACLLLTEKGQETFCRLRRMQIGMLCDWLTDFKKRLEEGELNEQRSNNAHES